MWYHGDMFEDPIGGDGLSGGLDDPRIETMIRQAGTLTELVLNAEFLLDEWVTDFLKHCPEIYEMSRQVVMTPEQRCRLVMWYTEVLVEDPADMGQTFSFLLAICRAKADLGRISEPKLLGQLGDAFRRNCCPDAHEVNMLGGDPFQAIRNAVAGHLAYADDFLLEEAMSLMDEDFGEEEE